MDGSHERRQRIGVVEEPRVRAELFHVPGDGDELRNVTQGAKDAARSDAIADGLTDTVRFGNADVSLPGPHPTDGDGDGDEIGSAEHLSAVGGIFDPQSDTAFTGDPLGVAGHRLGRTGVDVDERDGGVREERGPGQIGDEAGGENRAARRQ